MGADDELPTVRKVSAFITRGSQLMVFRKPYHPPCTVPRTWRHGESHPSSGPDQFIPFDFFWIDIQRARGELRADDHSALAVLQQLPGETSDSLQPDRRDQFGQGTVAW